MDIYLHEMFTNKLLAWPIEGDVVKKCTYTHAKESTRSYVLHLQCYVEFANASIVKVKLPTLEIHVIHSHRYVQVLLSGYAKNVSMACMQHVGREACMQGVGREACM